MKAITEKLIVTGVVRLAYPSLYKPRPNKLDASKPAEYGLVVLFPKENTEFQPNAASEIQDMKLFMASVAKAKWGDKPGKVTYALKDGDIELNNDGEPRHPGYMYLRCNAPCMFPSGDEFKPNVFDGSKKLMDKGGKSGDWGKVLMDIFPYVNEVGKGISTRLKEVQFLYEGDAIGNVVAAGSGFDEEPNAHVMKVSTENLGPVDPDYNPHDDRDPFDE